MLMRPQLAAHLTKLCVDNIAGNNTSLRNELQGDCRKLSVPTSQCLLHEIDATGRGFSVISEMLAGHIGDDSEVVLKRCIAKMIGIPVNSLNNIPLRELTKQFSDNN